MPYFPARFLISLCILCWPMLAMAQGEAAQAQEAPAAREQPAAPLEGARTDPTASFNPPSIDLIQQRIDQVQADQTLDETAKDALLESLRETLALLQTRERELAERRQFIAAAASAPALVEQVQEELNEAVVPFEFEDFSRRSPDAALTAIRALLAEAQARQAAAQAELTRLESEQAAREIKLADAPRQLVLWREELAEATTALAALPEDPSDQDARVRRWQRSAQAAELAARIERLQAEVASYEAGQELLPRRQSLALRKIEAARRAIDRLQAAEAEAANRRARQAQQQAEQQADQVQDPELSRLAQATSRYAAQRLGPEGTLARLNQIRVAHDREQTRLDELERRARNTAARVRAAGLTELVGRSLRDELARLPEVDTLDKEQLGQAIGQAQFELIEIEDQLLEYGDAQAAIARIRERLSADGQPLSPQLEEQLTSIVINYVQTLEDLKAEYEAYYEEALELVTTRTTLAETTKAFRAYIEERILWTRSVQGSAVPTVEELTRGAVWLLGGRMSPSTATVNEGVPIGSKWLRAIGDLWPPDSAAFAVAIAFIASLWARRRAAIGLKSLAGQVRKFATDRFTLTLVALPYTVLMALPLPIGMIFVGLLLKGADPQVSSAVGQGLIEAATLAFGLEFVRRAARKDGLAEAHFRWRRESLNHLWRLVFMLQIVLIPLAVVAFAFQVQPDVRLGDGVGRLAFVAGQLAIAAFFAWLLAPWLPFVGAYRARHPKGLMSQTRFLWYPLVVAVPVVFAVLAGAGYYYTAAQLDQRLQLTIWLLVAILVGYSLVLRWLFVERRRLLVKRAQQKREAERQEQEQSQPAGVAGASKGEIDGIELEAPVELDAAEVDTQTRRVLVAATIVSVVLGVYSLWTEQLPALRMLDRIQLYPSPDFIPAEDARVDAPAPLQGPAPQGTAQQPAQQPAGQASEPGGLPGGLFDQGSSPEGASEPVRAITLADVGAALIFFALTWVLARNLPGLLEITILKRLPLDGGARFAVTSILRYIIAIIGILLAFGAVGIGWSQVQFLAAALTFGLAFGLQEIFANFISGLIMLVERPVRVGDTVTVHDLNGKVTRIRMRATTILDWELREVIVPNKVFITEEFTNWTLSDPRIRVTVPVGVSYEADVRLVERTLLEIGQSHPNVVKEPKVRSLFVGFGDSTLNFELRAYLENYDYYLDARSALHTRVAERFRELGIEIAFPQRDLHVRDIGPLAEALEGRRRDEGPDAPRP